MAVWSHSSRHSLCTSYFLRPVLEGGNIVPFSRVKAWLTYRQLARSTLREDIFQRVEVPVATSEIRILGHQRKDVEITPTVD